MTNKIKLIVFLGIVIIFSGCSIAPKTPQKIDPPKFEKIPTSPDTIDTNLYYWA